jgi:hypothetical protein
MELLEYMLFLMINVILIVLALYKRMGLFCILGMLFSIMVLPLSFNLVLDRYYSTEGAVPIYANPTLMAIIGIIIIFMHGVTLLKLYKGM